MKGIIKSVVAVAMKKGKSLNVIKRFLKLKYRINVSLEVLKTRIKNGK
tara:strand:+ start:551 stop:694 length:144 start_codon:yes stop_codon:yes gene_type:complete